jgi:hypothetical protein
LNRRGASTSACTITVSSSADKRAAARPAIIDSAASTESWQVNALVEATPISGPASVGKTALDSRAMVDSRTLTTAPMVRPLSRQ